MRNKQTKVYILEDEKESLELLKTRIINFCESGNLRWPKKQNIEFVDFDNVDSMIESISSSSGEWRGGLLFLDLNLDDDHNESQGHVILQELSDKNLYNDVTKVIYSALDIDKIVNALKSLKIKYTDSGTENEFSEYDICEFFEKGHKQNKVNATKKLCKIFQFHAQLSARVFAENTNNVIQDNITFLKNEGFVGDCEKIILLREEAAQAAITSFNIILLGETGVGKNFLAKYIHKCSNYKDGKYINFASGKYADNQDLMNSDLFGHKKGSFTGAILDKIGKFEEANHGTIFIDEIGLLSLSSQERLLEFFNERSI